ncbi:unnamed protein product [Pedinophyceae sp. YPF-701]|nr:unnamed protein product [Pedinophyceae sp. YPF-701]
MAEVGARLRSGALRGLFYHNFVEGPQFVPGLPTTATSLSLVPAAGRLLAYDQHVGPKGWLGDVGKAGAFYARSHVTHPVVDSLKLMWTDAHDNAVVVGYSYGAGNVVVDTSFLSLALEGSRLADDGRAGPATEAAWVNVLDWLVSAEPEREHRCPAVVASEQVVRASGDGAFVRVALTPDSTQVPGSEHWPLSITTCSSSEGPTSGNAEDDDCRLEHGAAEVRTAREEGGPGRLYQLAWIMEIPGGGHCEGWIWVCVARTDPDDSADAAAVPGEPVCPDQADPEILWREVATAEHHHGHDHDDDA